jgi:hypothetical protein
MIVSTVPRLIWTGLMKADLGLVVLGLDLAVPPLSLLALLVIGVFALTLLGALLNSSFIPLAVSSAVLLGFGLASIFAWLKYGKDALPLRSALLIPSYVLAKIPMYRRMLSSKSVPKWIRTDRDKVS